MQEVGDGQKPRPVLRALLRQVVWAARDPDAVRVPLSATGPWRPAGGDEGALAFGVASHVQRLGGAVAEVIVPTREDTPAARLLRSRDTDATPYMLVFQLLGLGDERELPAPPQWRVWHTVKPGYDCVHLHPKTLPPALTGLAWTAEPYGWPVTDELSAAGEVRGDVWFSAVTVAAPDVAATAAQWAGLLGGQAEPAGDGGLFVRAPAVGVHVLPSPDGRPALVGVRLSRSHDTFPPAADRPPATDEHGAQVAGMTVWPAAFADASPAEADR